MIFVAYQSMRKNANFFLQNHGALEHTPSLNREYEHAERGRMRYAPTVPPPMREGNRLRCWGCICG
jgi:hypothetical protein